MNTNALVTALKSKYQSPRRVLAALGLDAALLDDSAGTKPTAEIAAAALKTLVREMPPEEVTRLGEIMKDALGHSTLAEWANSEEVSQDDEPLTPSARVAQDRARRRGYGFDAATEADFARRYPHAAKIRNLG